MAEACQAGAQRGDATDARAVGLGVAREDHRRLGVTKGSFSVHARMVVEAASDARVAAAVVRITERRLDGLAALLRSCGLTPAVARARAPLLYSAFMGLQQLHRELPDRLADPRARRALARTLVEAATG